MVAAFPYLWDSYAGDTGSVIVGGLVAAGLVLAPVAWAALSGKWASLLGAITGTWAVWLLAHLGAGARTFVILAPLAVVTVREIFDGRKAEHARRQYEVVANAHQAAFDGGDGLHDLVGTSTTDGR
jgi:energy-converting hydrogenase Eha subunit B